MNPETVGLISDAIKILGPAGIAAYATYRASKVQIDIKLKELDKTHEFTARQSLFQYYRDRQVELDEAHEKLSNEIGGTIGYMSVDENKPMDATQTKSALAGICRLYSRAGVLEIEATMRDMKAQGLDDSEEYARLIACCDEMRQATEDTSDKAAQGLLLMILEAYGCLRLCNHMLLARQMENTFSKYTQG